MPLALVLWLAGVHAVQPAAMNDYGLLPALPVVFFVGLGLLVASISALFAADRLSPVRLGLHLVALVVMLHGTVPLIFTQPSFPWVYKHVGVVNYIHLRGGVDSSVDIYQNWPGFFALSAWFDNAAGVGSPLTYAAWAPVYFNLLTCLELAFVFRSLPMTRRVRWLALFLFVAGNWVGQDYFAPQAMAFVLSLAVFGMVLAWFQVDRPPAIVRAVRRLASHLASRRLDSSEEPDNNPAPSLSPMPRIATMGALFATFAVVTVIHPLSPYVVILGVGLLTVAGAVRPRWLVVGFLAVAIAYLFVRLPYIRRTQDLFASLGDPLHNINSAKPTGGVVMNGRRLTALAAPALIAGLWTLGMLGILRRLRARRTALVVALLAASPVLIALGQSYGGEAVFRIYLFSLPWIAVLAASALDPRPRRWPLWSATKVAAVLSVTVALFMGAFFGALELYLVRPGEVAASQYFYDQAEPDSVFFTLTALMFPIRVSGNYDKFRAIGDNPPNLLTTAESFRHKMLGADDLPAISAFVNTYVSGGASGRYLVLSTGQDIYARVLGLLPPGSMASLDQALRESPNWSVFYRNPDAVIYQSLLPTNDQRPGGGPVVPPARTRAARPARPGKGSLNWVALGTGLLGMNQIVLAWRRRRSMAADHAGVPLSGEETMPSIAATKLRVPITDREVLLRQSLPRLDRSGEAVAELRHLLRDDPSSAVRVAAIRALAGAPEGDQLWALSVAVGDPAPEVRTSAIETLPVVGTVRAARSVLAASEDGHEHVRQAAYLRLAATTPGILWMAIERCSRLEELCAVLRQWAPKDRLAALVLERSSSPEPHDRMLALELAGRLETSGWVEESVNALQDQEVAIRRAAVAQLHGRPEAVPALVVALQDDPDPMVRTGAASALYGVDVDNVLLAFIGALEDPEVDVQRTAINSLVRCSSHGLARRVGKGLTIANSGSVGQVLLRMGSVGEDALVVAAAEGPRDRASAAASLLRKTGTVTSLLRRMGAVDPTTRLFAVEALGALGGAEGLGGLIGALSDSRPEIRSRAAFHLGEIGDQGGRDALQRVFECEQVAEVLRAAADALRLIDERSRLASVRR